MKVIKGKSTLQQREDFYSSSEWASLRSEYWSDLYREERDRVDDRDYEPVFNCTYCGRELSTCSDDLFPTLDHFYPLHSHFPMRLDHKNVVPCCKQCNQIKGGMNPKVWVAACRGKIKLIRVHRGGKIVLRVSHSKGSQQAKTIERKHFKMVK